MRAAVLAVAGLLAAAGPALAHRGHATLSVVEINADTGAVTVTHRMAAHDVEPALVEIAPDAQPSLDDPAAVEALKAYAGRVFVLRDAEGRRTPLTLSAAALAGDDVELRYEGRLPPPARSVTVDSGLLEETHADQENQVNVRRAGVTQTVVFRVGAEPQTVTFE